MRHENALNMKKFVVLALLMFALFNISASAQTAIPVTQLPTIKVTGTAEIQVVPDTATLSFSVIEQDKSVAEAKKQNDEIIAKVSTTAKRFGVAPIDIKTDYIRVKEVTKRIKSQTPGIDYEEVFDGYQVSRNLIIKLRDISKFEAFLTALLDTGVSDVDNVAFSSSELRKHKDQARAQAIRAAKEKATAIAKEIGQTIGKAVSIEENNVDGYRSAGANFSQNSFSVADDDDAGTTNVGAITIKAQVEVLFLLN